MGRIARMGRLREAMAPREDERGGRADNDLARLWPRSNFTGFQRKLLEELHHRQSLEKPKEDAVFEVESSGASVAEVVDGGVRFWNLNDPSGRPTIYRGLPGRIVGGCSGIQFGRIAAGSQSGQIAWGPIGRPQAPEFLSGLTPSARSHPPPASA